MKKHRLYTLLSLTLILALLVGCGGNPPPVSDSPSVSEPSSESVSQSLSDSSASSGGEEALKYRYAAITETAVESSQFGFRLAIPTGYRVLSDRELEELMGITAEIYRADDEISTALEQSGELLIRKWIVLFNETNNSVFQIQFTELEEGQYTLEEAAVRIRGQLSDVAENVGDLAETELAGRPAYRFTVTMDGSPVLVYCCLQDNCVMEMMGIGNTGLEQAEAIFASIEALA